MEAVVSSKGSSPRQARSDAWFAGVALMVMVAASTFIISSAMLVTLANAVIAQVLHRAH